MNGVINNMTDSLFNTAKDLLISLIKTPSLSREEGATADVLHEFFTAHSIKTKRILNNIIVYNTYFDEHKPTILLNSHHDTVKPANGWLTDPFTPILEDGKIIGLGSNDAGGPLVALIAAFLHFYNSQDLAYNLVLVASAEEEVSGTQGIECILPQLPSIALGIVGEPTSLNMAIAEKGLLVLDCVAKGVAGHAAHSTGENAIYKAIQDIEWFKNYQFPKISNTLGPVKMTVTGIQAGKQHNVVPDQCSFMVDVRTTDMYSNEEVFEIVKSSISSDVVARSFRLQPSSISGQHPIVLQAQKMGCTLYGSPTLSDQAFMKNFPTVKIGPGDTHRSHTAGEYILEDELRKGIETYINLLDGLKI